MIASPIESWHLDSTPCPVKCAGGSRRANPSKGDLGSPQEENGDDGRDSRIYMGTSWQQQSCEAREGEEAKKSRPLPPPLSEHQVEHQSSSRAVVLLHPNLCSFLFTLTLVTERVYLPGTILSVS